MLVPLSYLCYRLFQTCTSKLSPTPRPYAPIGPNWLLVALTAQLGRDGNSVPLGGVSMFLTLGRYATIITIQSGNASCDVVLCML